MNARVLLSLVMVVSMHQAIAQRLMVANAYLAYNQENKSLKRFDFLSLNDTIELSFGGSVILLHESGQSITLDSTGRFLLSTVISNSIFESKIKLLDLLDEAKDIGDQKNKTTGSVKAGMPEFPRGMILGDDQTKVLNDTVLIPWKYLPCHGSQWKEPCDDLHNDTLPAEHHLLITNIFEDELARINRPDSLIQLIWQQEWPEILIIRVVLDTEKTIYGSEKALLHLKETQLLEIQTNVRRILKGKTKASRLALAIYLKQQKMTFDALLLFKQLAEEFPNHPHLLAWYSDYYELLLDQALKRL